jgi:GxxExxY protein
MPEKELLYPDLTENIIGSALEVHKTLGIGTGFLESVYEQALSIEFDLRKMPYCRQKTFEVIYKSKSAKQFSCDFVVYDKIILEIKAIKKISEIEQAQVINYLKASGLKLGLLVNFGSSSLEFKRFIYTNQCNP